MKKLQLNFNFSALTFISSDEEIKKHIINTTIFKYIHENYKDIKELGQLLEKTQYGFTASAQEAGNVRLFRISDIRNNQVNWETVPYCECKNDSYLLKENDILVARTGGTTGKSFCVDKMTEDTVFASYLIRLTASEKVNHQYIMLFLNSYIYWNQIFIMKSGSAQPNVNAEKLKKLLIPFCNLDLQQKFIDIANNLETNDKEFKPLVDKINYALNQYNLIKEKDNLTEDNTLLISKLRQAILQEAVQGKLVPQAQNDEPASELLKKIKAEKDKIIKDGKIKKEKPLPPISESEILYALPQGWEWVKLGKVVTDFKYGTSEKSDYSYNGIPVIRIPNISLNSLDLADLKFLQNNYVNDNNKVQRGDILIIRSNGSIELVGKAALIKKIETDLAFASYLIRLRPVLMFPEYLIILLNSSLVKNQFISGSQTTVGINNINTQTLSSTVISFPPLEEQKRIVQKVDELMALCDELEEQIKQSKTHSEQLMQSILQEAFNAEPVGDLAGV